MAIHWPQRSCAVSQGMNRYKADLRELTFVLFEQFKLHEVLGKPPFANWTREDCDMILSEAYRFATEVLGPTNAAGDKEGCKLVDGRVRVPSVFKDTWNKLYEAG